MADVIFVAVLIALFSWMALARIVRASFLSLREREYVEAAQALGASDRRIVIRHLIPNSLGQIIVWATLGATGAIGALAFGVSARFGLYAATLAVALALALLGGRALADDIVIGSTFAWVLGLGSLFLTLYTTPVVYIYLDRLQVWLFGEKRKQVASSSAAAAPAE